MGQPEPHQKESWKMSDHSHDVIVLVGRGGLLSIFHAGIAIMGFVPESKFISSLNRRLYDRLVQ